jgi:hypothetical protein
MYVVQFLKCLGTIDLDEINRALNITGLTLGGTVQGDSVKVRTTTLSNYLLNY